MVIKQKSGEKHREVVGSGEIVRVRTPRDNEVIGIVEQLLSHAKMYVRCADEKVRNCRIPGRFLRRMWVRPHHVVLVKPWDLEGDKRGDVIYKYSKSQIAWLRNKGFLKELEEF